MPLQHLAGCRSPSSTAAATATHQRHTTAKYARQQKREAGVMSVCHGKGALHCYTWEMMQMCNVYLLFMVVCPGFIVHWLLCLPSAIFCPLSTVYSSAVYCLPSAVYSSAVFCLLSTVYCLLSTVYCLLSTVYCLLSTVYSSAVYHLLSTIYSLLSNLYCLLTNVSVLLSAVYCVQASDYCLLLAVSCSNSAVPQNISPM